MVKFLRKFSKDTEGTTSIEFAIVGTTFIMLLLVVMELGRYMFIWNSLQYAAEQTTRYALVNEDAPIGEVEAYAVLQFPSSLVDPASLSLDISYTTTSGIDFIEISATYDYVMFSPVMLGGILIDWDLRANARLPVP